MNDVITVKELAARFGVSPGAARERLDRARVKALNARAPVCQARQYPLVAALSAVATRRGGRGPIPGPSGPRTRRPDRLRDCHGVAIAAGPREGDAVHFDRGPAELEARLAELAGRAAQGKALFPPRRAAA